MMGLEMGIISPALTQRFEAFDAKQNALVKGATTEAPVTKPEAILPLGEKLAIEADARRNTSFGVRNGVEVYSRVVARGGGAK